MLCSICNKNTAVIFINKKMPDNSIATEGLCYSCAKEKGVNPLEALAKQANLSEDDFKNMSNQIESMFTDMTNNIDMDDIMHMEEMLSNEINNNEDINNPDAPKGIPLGSIFSGFFGNANNDNLSNQTENSSSNDKKKVKVIPLNR